MKVRMPGADPEKASEPGGLLAEGKYVFRVTWAEERKSKQNDPQILLECEPLMQSEGAEFDHATVVDFITFIEKTKNLNAHKLRILGQAPGDWSEFELDVDALKGALFVAQVVHSKGAEKTFANMRYWKSLEEVGIDQKQFEDGKKVDATTGFEPDSPAEFGSDEVPF